MQTKMLIPSWMAGWLDGWVAGLTGSFYAWPKNIFATLLSALCLHPFFHSFGTMCTHTQYYI